MINTIIENIDTWISAKVPKASRRGRSANSKDPYGIKKLRELILELAVRGKLASQDPADEPASLLLGKITKEREGLIKEGEIKKQKQLVSITEEEKPYELPEGWEWTRLGNIGNIFNGTSINAKVKETKYSNIDGGLPFIATKDVGYGWQELDYINGVSIPEDEKYFRVAHEGAVLICAEGGSAGKKCGITNHDVCFGNKLFAIELYGDIEPKYILANYLSPIFYEQFSERMTGIIGGISASKFSQLLIPVPSLKEQNRIATKVDELISICDQLEQEQTRSSAAHQTLVATLLATLTNSASDDEFAEAWSRIADHFNTLFNTEDSIERLKEAILQLAVMGKLVPQDPNDEPISVLLKKTKEEKMLLIKEGAIKKEKLLPEISEKEKPFELPSGWSFARLGCLSKLITKGSSPKWQDVSYTENPEDVLFITSENVGSHTLRLASKKYVEKKFNKVEPRSILEKGDFLMNIVGASIGRTAIYNIDDLANINQAVCLIRVFEQALNSQFLLQFFNSEICISYMFDKQVDNARANLSMGNIGKFVIPLPPLAEQKRIVDKVYKLMTLCDLLKDKIANSKATQVHLANAIVKEAVA